MRKEISFLIIAFMLFSFPLVLAHGDVDDYYDDHHNNMMGGWYGGFGVMWIFMWVFWILVFTALVLFIAWMIKQLQKK